MKILIYLFVAVFAVCVLARRPVFEISSLGWESSTVAQFPKASLASSKDLLAYYDSTEMPRIAVRRRNSEGGYDLIAYLDQNPSPTVRTNGKWVWTDLPSLYKIDNNNQTSGPYLVAPNYGDVVGGSMLSDDTFVTYNTNDFKLVTYQYQAQYNNWTRMAGNALDIKFPVYSNADLQSYRAYDNHLVIADTNSSSIKIYQRQADKSWKLNDTITVAAAGTNNVGVHYNGVDTVLFILDKELSDKSQGVVYMYTKKNGAWSQQMFNTSSVGYIPQGNLGASCAFIDQNTLIVSAGTADYFNSGIYKIGRVLMMTKTNGGDWTPHVDIIGDDSDVFGLSVAVNDYDLLVHDYGDFSSRLRVYAAPRCFAQPINVTCNSPQLNDCSSLNNAQLYTINSSPRCGAITPLLNGVSLVDKTMQAKFTFTRFEIESFSCNATVTCPALVFPGAPTAKKNDGSMIQSFSIAVLAVYLAVL